MAQTIIRGCLVGVGITLSACGGGGGSGGSSSIAYSGVSTPATLTASNGETLATSAYENGASGDSVAGVLASLNSPSGDDGFHGPRTQTLLNVLKQDVETFTALSTQNSAGIAKATQTASGTETGDCGGTAAYSISVNDINNEFSGTITYSGFCDDIYTITGRLSFQGSYANNAFDSTTLTLDDLTIVAGSESLAVDGTITASQSGATTTVVSNLLMQNASGGVFKTEDLTIVSTAFSTYDEVSYSGRFYHPDYGYVTLSTPSGEAFVVYHIDDYPSSGQLVATGANGGTATLTATSNTTYQLDINAPPDVSTINGNWADI